MTAAEVLRTLAAEIEKSIGATVTSSGQPLTARQLHAAVMRAADRVSEEEWQERMGDDL